MRSISRARWPDTAFLAIGASSRWERVFATIVSGRVASEAFRSAAHGS